MTTNQEYEKVKASHISSKVPFSNTQRNRVEGNYKKFDKVNGYGASVSKTSYKWKVPTYDV